MSVLAWLWTATGRAFAKWAGIAALVLAVLWKARESGRDAERVRQQERDLEALRKRNTIDDEVDKLLTIAFATSLLAGCASTTSGGCDGFKPIRPSSSDVPVISSGLAGQIVAHNRFGQATCGWRP